MIPPFFLYLWLFIFSINKVYVNYIYERKVSTISIRISLCINNVTLIQQKIIINIKSLKSENKLKKNSYNKVMQLLPGGYKCIQITAQKIISQISIQ